MRAIASLTAVLALTCCGSAAAAGWMAPTVFPAGSPTAVPTELAPRGSVADDGTAVVAWSVFDERAQRGIYVSTRDRADGPFGHRRRLTSTASDVSVAALPGGGAAVAWTQRDGAHVAVRRSARNRFVQRTVVRVGSGSISGAELAADPTGGYVLVERRFPLTGSGLPYTLRAVRLGIGGLPGTVVSLGRGFVSLDARPAFPLAVDDAGRARLAFDGEGESSGALVTAQPGRPFPAAGRGLGGVGVVASADPRVAVGPGGVAAVAYTSVTRSGDAGSFGAPTVGLSGPDGSLSARRVALTNPGRAFGPSVASLGDGRFVLAWQQKTAEDAFSRQAPVRAATVDANGRIGTARTVTSAQAQEPVVVALTGARVLAVFGAPERFAAALAGSDGRFHAVAAPRGRASTGHFNETNRDVRSAGRYAIVTWADAGAVRVSLRRF